LANSPVSLFLFESQGLASSRQATAPVTDRSGYFDGFEEFLLCRHFCGVPYPILEIPKRLVMTVTVEKCRLCFAGGLGPIAPGIIIPDNLPFYPFSGGNHAVLPGHPIAPIAAIEAQTVAGFI
jgi:hypothetical protein